MADEIDAYLRRGNMTALFTLRADGMPTGWMMTSEFEDGEVLMSTYAKSAKVCLLSAAGEATCVMFRKAADVITSAVAVSGPITVRRATAEDQRRRSERGHAAGRFLPAPKEVTEAAARREAAGKRVLLSLQREQARLLVPQSWADVADEFRI